MLLNDDDYLNNLGGPELTLKGCSRPVVPQDGDYPGLSIYSYAIGSNIPCGD